MLTVHRYIWGNDVEMSEALGSHQDRAELVRFTVLCLHIKC